MDPGHWKGVTWLYSQLPDLVQRGLLPPDSAEKLRAHYGEPPASAGSRILIAIFAIIGSLLIGGGVILLLAHNWDDLGRPARVVLSLIPLLIAQLLGLHARLNHPESTGWNEGTALFQSLMIGAAIALVGQTYHISGDFRGFILVWLLLIVPVIFLYRSTVAALLYCGLFQMWAFAEWQRPETWQYWALLAPPALAYAWRFFQAPASWHSAALGYAFLLTLGITTPYILRDYDSTVILFYSGLAATCYLAHRIWVPESAGAGRRPLYFLGAGSICLLTLILGFRDLWGNWRYDHPIDHFNIPTILVYAITAACALKAVRDKRPVNWVAAAFPLVVAIVYALAEGPGNNTASAILMNLYGFALGIYTIHRGVREYRLGITNIGLILLVSLILTRFMISDFGLFERGIAFVLFGLGFLGVNIWMLRKNRRTT